MSLYKVKLDQFDIMVEWPWQAVAGHGRPWQAGECSRDGVMGLLDSWTLHPVQRVYRTTLIISNHEQALFIIQLYNRLLTCFVITRALNLGGTEVFM